MIDGRSTVSLYEDNSGGLTIASDTLAFVGLERADRGSFGYDVRSMALGDTNDWTFDQIELEDLDCDTLVAQAELDDSGATIVTMFAHGLLGSSAARYVNHHSLIDPENHGEIQIALGSIEEARSQADKWCNEVNWGHHSRSPIPAYTEILDCNGSYVEIHRTFVEVEVR